MCIRKRNCTFYVIFFVGKFVRCEERVLLRLIDFGILSRVRKTGYRRCAIIKNIRIYDMASLRSIKYVVELFCASRTIRFHIYNFLILNLVQEIL